MTHFCNKAVRRRCTAASPPECFNPRSNPKTGATLMLSTSGTLSGSFRNLKLRSKLFQEVGISFFYNRSVRSNYHSPPMKLILHFVLLFATGFSLQAAGLTHNADSAPPPMRTQMLIRPLPPCVRKKEFLISSGSTINRTLPVNLPAFPRIAA
jgi:hypothetical protein